MNENWKEREGLLEWNVFGNAKLMEAVRSILEHGSFFTFIYTQFRAIGSREGN